MNQTTGDAKYADVIELATYNGSSPGISLSRRQVLLRESLASRGTHHPAQRWYGLRLLPAESRSAISRRCPRRIYATRGNDIYIHPLRRERRENTLRTE